MEESNSKDVQHFDLAIVGAGISGLTIAHALKDSGQSIVIIEKSRGLGGRMATRRDEEWAFDHGAQFYEVVEAPAWHQLLIESNVVRPWSSQGRSNLFVARGGMTQIAKRISHSAQVQLNQRVVRLEENQNGFIVECENQRLYQASCVVLTAPLPQSLDILAHSGISFSPGLRSIQYAKAVVGLFGVRELSAPDLLPSYIQPVDTDIRFISEQSSKMTSTQPAFTVVMTPEWSETHYELPDDKNLVAVQKKLETFFEQQGVEIEIVRSQLKKWRYSHPITTQPQGYFQIATSTPLFLTGDAFAQEGTIQGACAVAEKLAEQLRQLWG